MALSTSQAQSAIKKVYGELASLNPSALITLYEISIEENAADAGLTLLNNDVKVFRFHNNVKLTSSSLVFQGKTYIAAPIQGEGFEASSKGQLPTPKLSLTVDSTSIEVLALFKTRLRELGDLVGAKVTRIRTFARFLDAVNWSAGEMPEGFEPDPLAELPRDIYYIDRKSNENKFTLEFELASVLDLEGLKLPARVIYAKRCQWTYRGEGCCYEYNNLKNSDVHGDAVLPFSAPPVANEKDELILDLLDRAIIRAPQLYDSTKLASYVLGDSVYITKNGINYYFVCRRSNPQAEPPNTVYWIPDNCSKSIIGCRIRWGTSGKPGSVGLGNSGLVQGHLPIGAYPAADKVA